VGEIHGTHGVDFAGRNKKRKFRKLNLALTTGERSRGFVKGTDAGTAGAFAQRVGQAEVAKFSVIHSRFAFTRERSQQIGLGGASRT
jgi:hypothetical protein